MNFKLWLLSEELYPNKNAIVYHRTSAEKKISNILTSGFESGSGDYYGKGFYATFALESQFTKYMERYGNFVVKFKITDLDKYLICQLSTAKYILGNEYSISSQFKKFNIEATQEQLDKYDKTQMKSNFSSSLASLVYGSHANLTSKCKGIIFRGESDGYVLVKYEPVNDASITMIGYAEATVNDFEKMNILAQNKEWITSTNKAKIKNIYSLPKEKKTDYKKDEFDNIINILLAATPATIPYLSKKYESEIKNIPYNKILDLIIRTPYKEEMTKVILTNKPNIPDDYIEAIIYELKDKNKICEMIIKNKKEISDDLFRTLFYHATNKEEMAEIIINKKTKLSDDNVVALLDFATDKDKMAQILGSDNINKLDDDHVYNFLYNVNDKEKIAELIIKYKSELSDESVYNLLHFATNKDKIAEMIIKYKTELSDGDVYNLLKSATDKNKMAELIIKYKTELSGEDVRNLLYFATDKDKMAQLIIEKKPKLSSDDVYYLNTRNSRINR